MSRTVEFVEEDVRMLRIQFEVQHPHATTLHPASKHLPTHHHPITSSPSSSLPISPVVVSSLSLSPPPCPNYLLLLVLIIIPRSFCVGGVGGRHGDAGGLRGRVGVRVCRDGLQAEIRHGRHRQGAPQIGREERSRWKDLRLPSHGATEGQGTVVGLWGEGGTAE